ncbi:MAG TPA: hypothetical protein VGV35_09225 [Bryobacteraceae bacterium]|nr:hypothetical protein [Bryobacteraceae bacterium]
MARCPVCLRFFCRECVTEHEDRVICAECLRKIVAARASRTSGLRLVFGALLPFAGLIIAWLFFYGVGRSLLLIPASVHDGTIWESK